MADRPALPHHDPGATELVPATQVAEWPPGTFLENIAPLADGRFLVTNKDGARIERVGLDGDRTLFATLPEGVTGVDVGAAGEVYATGRVKGGPETVYRVDAGGRVEVLAELPTAGFLNGLTRIGPHTLLVADSGTATVWKVDTATGTASPWLVDELLGHRDPAHRFPATTWIPGANGVKRFRDAVFVSSTDRALVLRVPLGTDGGAGEPVVWARDVVVDDFAFDLDGNLYGTTHPFSSVVRIRPDGSRSTIATGAEGVVGATAVAFGTRPGDECSLYVVGNSRIPFDGRGDHPARLVRLQLEAPGYPRYHHRVDAARVRQVPRLQCWIVTTRTLPGTEEQRRAQAPAYTAHLERHLHQMLLGGQVQDGPGGPVSTRFYLLRTADAATARAVIETSPYHRHGVYTVVDVQPFTGMGGELMHGVAWVPKTNPAA
ncbi:MAG TPA: YciI family protein [Ramlibacter sp.]|nr:YciI family protein [Ramlibacter sp.]